MPALSSTVGSAACAVSANAATARAMNLVKRLSKKKKAGSQPCLSCELEAGYFLSILSADFFSVDFFFEDFFLSDFFSILASPFLSCAPAWAAARAEPV